MTYKKAAEVLEAVEKEGCIEIAPGVSVATSAYLQAIVDEGIARGDDQYWGPDEIRSYGAGRIWIWSETVPVWETDAAEIQKILDEQS